MACSNCGKGSTLQPARSNGGLYIVSYIGEQETPISLIGEETGVVYTFGIHKKEFWVNHLDLPGLFADKDYGTDLRSKVQ